MQLEQKMFSVLGTNLFITHLFRISQEPTTFWLMVSWFSLQQITSRGEISLSHIKSKVCNFLIDPVALLNWSQFNLFVNKRSSTRLLQCCSMSANLETATRSGREWWLMYRSHDFNTVFTQWYSWISKCGQINCLHNEKVSQTPHNLRETFCSFIMSRVQVKNDSINTSSSVGRAKR